MRNGADTVDGVMADMADGAIHGADTAVATAVADGAVVDGAVAGVIIIVAGENR